ncbi:hypothetical protein HPB51_019190 [Rhipicephalus microplus]|uniref:Uncharacterized protein n=1 Tax=Rhipicephalus microplus TaxID=6941 RepID=A0A9J6EBC8_RHIMP|nr:hypothetical protein HPB51_019190 [Rhipicephalus microplus]
MEVCPNPTNRISRGCGLLNPSRQHQCSPKCNLCGGTHMITDKNCRGRYKTPYVIRRRRWEHRSADNQWKQQDYLLSETAASESRSHSRSQSRSHSNTRLTRSPRGSRSTTPAPVAKVSWADKVRGTACEGVGKAPTASEQTNLINTAIIDELRKENAVMRELVQKLTQEVQELRRERAVSGQNKHTKNHPVATSVPDVGASDSDSDAGAPASKKRAIQPLHEEDSEIQYELKLLTSRKCCAICKAPLRRYTQLSSDLQIGPLNTREACR